LILLQNPFTVRGQQEWIMKCLKEYTKKPNILNIDAHDLLKNKESWWDTCFG
jgi:alkylated DNA repair protein alkB family protein 1